MRKQQPDILKILIMVMAGVIAVFAIFMVVFLASASKKLKAIELSPDFAYNELEVGTQYTFSINATPKKASLKKVEAVVDDSSCSFEIDGDKAILTTGLNEGTVTVYVKSKDIKSQVLTFGVVDSVARAEAEAAQAAAIAQAEAEAAAAEEAAAEAEAQTLYVKCVGDDVRVRAQNNTDCDILGKAKNGECFEKVEEVDDWTHIIYKGQDAYMKTEYLTEVSEEEAMSATPAENTEEEKKEEKKTEEKKEENTNTDSATQSKEEAEAKAKAAAEAEAAAAAQAQAELEAQLAAAAAAQAASGMTINCADGPHTFPPQKYNFIKGFWSYTGDWEAMAHKHTASELDLICSIEGGIN